MRGGIAFRTLSLVSLWAAAPSPPAATVLAALRPDEVSMGTTILAVRYDGGVVVGADTRTSVSGYVSNRHAAKLTFVLDRNADDFVKVSTPSAAAAGGGEGSEGGGFSTCVVCRSGSAADTQALASAVRTELVSRRLLYGMRGTVSQAAALLRNLLVDSDLTAGLICAGYDHERRDGTLYAISPGGTTFEEREWAAGGSGSSYVLGHLDARYPKDGPLLSSEEEALEFVSGAIGLAMERDGSSGGFVRMYVIDRNGKRFVSAMPNAKNRGMLNGDEEGLVQSSASGGVPLRNFAPAASPVHTTYTK